VDATQSGACALALLLHGNRLWVAGAGDCRAVLGAVDDKTGQLYAIRLSLDHKPTDPQELARITAAGACVWEGVKDHEEGYEPPRVYRDLHNRRLGPGLAMSRCLGDLDDTDAGISPTPTVRYWDLCSDGSRNGRRDLFILMASDGVWEHLSDEEAVALIGRFHAAGQSARVACTNLMAHAALRWRREEGNYRDDITAICAYLPCVNERSERATLDAAALGAAQTEPGTRRA
jgi:serine/threonine protein phosphatase PrpC